MPRSLHTLLLHTASLVSAGVLPHVARAQNDIADVRVETYYIADANDATDTTGGGLAEGSTTYRIFIQLAEGRSLRALYATEQHPLHITSTAPLFNHLDRGKRYGHEVNNGALDEGVVALDSWLSLGAASNQRIGVRKAMDTDGSLLGGADNDGGSAAVSGGLLNNNAAALGVPLTVQDGLTTSAGNVVPPNFLVTGDDPRAAFADSTLTTTFLSNDFRMGCTTPGVVGDTTTNEVLVAQVTTNGELSFALNIEVQLANGDVVRYVAADTLLAADETANGLLTYPQQCGCTDPEYLEYDAAAGCDDGSCATTIVFGCMDTQACNYDAAANFNIAQLCCYGPTDCNGLDIDLVCPGVGLVEQQRMNTFIIAPNPITDGRIHLITDAVVQQYQLVDITGRLVLNGNATGGNGLDVAHVPAGTYVLVLHAGSTSHRGTVIIPAR
ncbi:MAG: T9SS type A sorting domain-containing protein [Flavobacteriales bacterium]|nr:T9SS type A sorting domain-containing protein [Flavobacteriales bacterium]